MSLDKARADYAVLLLDKGELHAKLVLAAQALVEAFMVERGIEEGDEIMVTHRWSFGSEPCERRCRLKSIRCHGGDIIFTVVRIDSRGVSALRTYQFNGDSDKWRKP